MKIKLIAGIMSIMLVVGLLPMSASALVSESTDVTYNLEYGYTLNIPTNINFSKGQTFEMTATEVFIGEGQVLAVSVDFITTELDSNFRVILKNDEGMACSFDMYSQNADGSEKTNLKDDHYVAYFRHGETTPYKRGTLSMTPFFSGGILPGTYHGTVHFIIETFAESELSE